MGACACMNYDDIISLLGIGCACGLILSVVPFVIGVIINFALKLMKGGD